MESSEEKDHSISTQLPDVEPKHEEVSSVVDRAESESYRMVLGLVQQHRSVYSQESVSRHFKSDVLKVAGKCWDQINENMHHALESKFKDMFDDFGVVDKLTELDRLREENDPSVPAWRPSGIPSLDSSEAEGVELRTAVIPQFETESQEVHSISSEIQKVLEDKQKQLQMLEIDIRNELSQLSDDVNVTV